MTSLPVLLKKISKCDVCAHALELGPRPVLSVGKSARVLIIGQAPGVRVHESGVAWNDQSGDRLRDWLGVDHHQFYDQKLFALMPMGFCYPGSGKSGDLPPRPECADLWHEELLQHLGDVKLTILLSRYAISRYLPQTTGETLTEVVQNWKRYTPRFLPLPHPSPRNNRWLKKNPWFEAEVLPYLRRLTSRVLK